MNILLFHPTVLPARHYGGVERVVLWLARGLREAGHRVWIAALPGSRLPDGIRLLEMDPEKVSAWDLLDRLPREVELVHFHAPPEAGVLEQMRVPGVLTVHGNGEPGETYPRNTVFLSADHARRHGAETYVYNGIDPDELEFSRERRSDWNLFLAKTNWKVKNLSGALRMTRKAGASIRVAGGNLPLSARLRVQFFMAGSRWVGPVDNRQKADLLGRARALVFPVLWPEPFGLVIAEALMAGAPVLGSPYGSLPELIPSEVGKILNSESEWVEVLRGGELGISSRSCRDWAMEKFHYRVMAKSYETVYARVLRSETLQSSPPISGDWRAEYDRALHSCENGKDLVRATSLSDLVES